MLNALPIVHCRRSLLLATLCALSTSATFAAPAQTAGVALPANQSLIDGTITTMKVAGKSASFATAKPANVSGAPVSGSVLRLEVRQRAASEYEIQYTLPLKPSADLKKGDVVWAGVWARMLATSDESGQGILGLVVEQNKDPFNKLIQRRTSITRDWHLVAVPVKLTQDYPADSLHFVLRVGGAAQTLELAGPQFVRFTNPASVKLNDLPQTRETYGGREPNAPWRKAADERIDQLRKGNLTIHVVDAAGQPVAGAQVTVAMQRHAFPFGSCYNVSEIVGDHANTPDGQTYQKKFADLFNVGVDEYAMKWAGWEEPKTKANALAALQWMDEHNIRVRGHCLVWPAWKRMPANVKDLQNDPAALAKRVNDHVRDEVSALSGRVTEWDVVNEPFVNHDLMDILGQPVMAQWFKTAHAADPKPRLFLNETSVPTSPPNDKHYDVLFSQVKMIQEAGGPIGGVGMQAHFGSSLTAINDLQTIYDRFATLGVPLQITELDINTNDPQLQADYLRDLMTITFAHPNSSGIMIWGFWAGQHWRPDAALFAKDWTLRPVGQAWLDLVKKKWWTNATLTTTASGAADIRGFLGDYQITVTANGKTQTVDAVLPKDGKTVEIVLK